MADEIEVPIPEEVRGPAMRGAWKAGYLAYQAKLALTQSPYLGNDTSGHYVNFRRGMASRWAEGWRYAQAERYCE